MLSGTIYAWVKAFEERRLAAKSDVHLSGNTLSLNEELIELRKHITSKRRKSNNIPTFSL